MSSLTANHAMDSNFGTCVIACGAEDVHNESQVEVKYFNRILQIFLHLVVHFGHNTSRVM